MKKILFIVIILGSALQTYSQIRDYELGAQITDQTRRNFGGFYDYSDPEDINIKISVWGFVKFPGKYIVPSYTNVIDLMSYVGGPLDDSNLDEIRLYRIDDNLQEQMIPIDLDDLMWKSSLDSRYRNLPQLKPSDILVIPGEPRLYFMDWFGIGLSIFSALISLAILILTIEAK